MKNGNAVTGPISVKPGRYGTSWMSRISPNTWSTWFVVQQSPGHQQRVISRQPSPVPPFVLSVDGRQIEFIGNIRYQSCQVVFRQPVL